MKSIFGHYIGEPEFEIVTHNDAAMAAMQEYTKMANRGQTAERLAGANNLRAKLIKAGVAASTVTGIIKAVKNYVHFETPREDNRAKTGNMRDRRDTLFNTDVSNRDGRNEQERIRQRNQRQEVINNARNAGPPMEVETDIFGDMADDSLPNLPSAPNTEEMDAAIAAGDGETQLMSARAGPAAGMASGVSKETPISIAQPSYGLQETHTTILPWTGWLSAAKLNNGGPVQLKIRMNSPYDMLDTTTVAANVKGISATGIGPDNTSAGGTPPEDFTASATEAYERPAWRDYWAALYDYYTVLGCEYEIICQNPTNLHQTAGSYTPYNTDAICAVQFDTYSSTATTTGNIMPLTRLSQVRAFKNIQWHKIKCNNGVAIIKGVYRPGQAKRNIVNDGDVKTWAPTGSSPTTLAETLTLNFWTDGLNNYGGAGVNMEINLKYIVQFKDLKLQARYPNSITSGQDIVQTLSNGINTAGGGQAMQN